MTLGEECRVLVVEDETMIAIMIESILTDLGCEVVGPASKLDTAMTMARDERLDAAVLDVTIRGGQVFPVAELLLGRSIPFALATGYESWVLPDLLKEQPRLSKPFLTSDLQAMIRQLCPRHFAVRPARDRLS